MIFGQLKLKFKIKTKNKNNVKKYIYTYLQFDCTILQNKVLNEKMDKYILLKIWEIKD